MLRTIIRAWKAGHWYMWHGRWWMVQCCFDGWVSVGIHIDPWHRKDAKTGIYFGPYVDLHLICFIISLGVNPKYSGRVDVVCSVGRGGIPAVSG